MTTTKEVEQKIHSHEEICALRYEAIHARLDKLERMMMKAMWTVLTTMAGIIGALALILMNIT